MSDICQTTYPVMLIHGTGFRDYTHINYWGRIPRVLEQHGATIYYGRQDSWGTIEQNANSIKAHINRICQETGVSKFNLIAHSKGGLDARYLISALDMANKVASLTTISTPHHGSKTIDQLYRFPKPVFKIAAFFVNLWFRILGDRHPDFFNATRGFTTAESVQFNERCPDAENVYYQSFGAAMKHAVSDALMIVPHFVIKLVEGENDGLVTTDSAKWSNFRGILRGASSRGISHCDVIDLRRSRLTKHKQTGCVSDITDTYVDIVAGLKAMGL